MAEVARSLKEDFGEKLEVEATMVEEKVGGVENKSLMGSKLMTSGEECLDGWVRAGGGYVKVGGVVFGVSRILLGVIPRDIMGKAVVRHLDLMNEPIDNRWVVREDDKEGTPVEGWRSNMDEH
ncbi:hypothetical protein Tco_1512409 [Tanacetum coccineum]